MPPWTPVGAIEALPPGARRVVVAGGRELVLYNVDGAILCTTAACSHRQGPLGEGTLDGAVITCPWHGWRFDVRSGACLEPGTRPPLRTFETRVDGPDVLVRLD